MAKKETRSITRALSSGTAAPPQDPIDLPQSEEQQKQSSIIGDLESLRCMSCFVEPPLVIVESRIHCMKLTLFVAHKAERFPLEVGVLWYFHGRAPKAAPKAECFPLEVGVAWYFHGRAPKAERFPLEVGVAWYFHGRGLSWRTIITMMMIVRRRTLPKLFGGTPWPLCCSNALHEIDSLCVAPKAERFPLEVGVAWYFHGRGLSWRTIIMMMMIDFVTS
ncbi:hypothetical protein CFP56_022925 [Quercus suber]|uniref:Uncharacterized protein n=1 Tax=Quercus suber TaxID=58331 RepID=A0AAW0KBM7_QUESU